MKVFKFGGASVKDAKSVRNVGSILSAYQGEKIVVVVSAMGKTTNKFEELFAALESKDEYMFVQKMQEIKTFHQEILGELFRKNTTRCFQLIDLIFDEVKEHYKKNNSASSDFLYDQIVSAGELISSHIVNEYLLELGLKSTWCDARRLIRTDDNYREANVDWETSKELITKQVSESFQNAEIILTQGFIGHASCGSTTTLGREGSDYSAGIFAHCCDAESVYIWKDVPGMLNADPKYFENTKKLAKISFKEAIELSYYGASVIHPKTIKPLQNKNIPLFVKSFIDPNEAGTEIQSLTKDDGLIPSFIVKKGQILFSLTPKDFSFINEANLYSIFKMLDTAHVKINLMQNSALSFSILVDAHQIKLEKLMAILQVDFDVRYNENLELVTIRHYDSHTIDLICKDKMVIIEQKTRYTARFVLKSNGD
jgi:aspartate kinase